MASTCDAGIAFAVITAVLSRLITIVVQMASAALSLRGKNLANALALTFQTIDPNIGKHAHSLAAQILRDPIFSDSMWRKKERPILDEVAQKFITAQRKLRDAKLRKSDDPNREWAITQAATEVEAAKEGLTIPEVKPNRDKPWGFWTLPWGSALQIASAIRPGEIYRVVQELREMSHEEAQLRDIPKELVDKATALIAVLQHWDQPAIESRGKLADSAGFELVPAGWFARWPKERFWWFNHLFGLALTAGLLTLGAPFWFNLLKNLTSLRPAVATLVEKRPTSAPALPPAPGNPPAPS